MKILQEGDQPTGLSTADLAKRLHIQPHSLRAALNTRGSYYGITPIRLPNGRLDWPGDSMERLTQAVHKPFDTETQDSKVE